MQRKCVLAENNYIGGYVHLSKARSVTTMRVENERRADDDNDDDDAAVILKDAGKETELDSDTPARHCDFNRIPSRSDRTERQRNR